MGINREYSLSVCKELIKRGFFYEEILTIAKNYSKEIDNFCATASDSHLKWWRGGVDFLVLYKELVKKGPCDVVALSCVKTGLAFKDSDSLHRGIVHYNALRASKALIKKEHDA